MNTSAFARGYVSEAYKHGVDPVRLYKMSSAGRLNKEAGVGPVGDVFAGIPSTMLLSPYSGVVNTAGYIAGLVDDEDNSQKTIGKSFIPGVSAYRMGNRIKTQVMRELEQIKKDKKHEGARPVAHAVAEHIGPATSTLASILAGAGIGAATKGSDGAMLAGGAIGGGVAVAANLIGSIAAAVKRRRTSEEQINADKGSLLAKYLIPGNAAYGHYKRIGRSQGERDEAEAAEKQEKNAPASKR